MKKKRDIYVQHDPTPEEIAEATAAIREGWTEDEYAKRAMAAKKPVQVTSVVAIKTDRWMKGRDE